MMMGSGLLDWIIDQRTRYVQISLNGELISEEWEGARASECNGCEFNGKVSPEGGLLGKTDGCTAPGCGCPHATKRWMYRHFRARGFKGRLKTIELWMIPILKNMIPGLLKIVTTECKHPDGNRWAEIDNYYKNK